MAPPRVRPSDSGPETVRVPKHRPVGITQMVATVLLVSMVFLIVYMYRVIEGLHREQQEMRVQLSQIAGKYGNPKESQPPHLVISPQNRPEFLEVQGDRPTGELDRLGKQAAAEKAKVEAETTVERGRSRGFRGRQQDTASDSFEQNEDDDEERRRLGAAFTTGRVSGVGCYEITDGASVTHDVSSANGCGTGVICPDCFVTPATVSQDITLTIQGCSSAKWIRTLSRTGIWMYNFVNTDATRTLSVTDNGGGITYKVPPNSFISAYCGSALGTTNRLSYPSRTLPTLIVESGLTLEAGNFDASGSSGTFTTSTGANTLSGDVTISGAKTFTTGTGAIALNSNVAIADTKTLTVGSAGSGGATTLYGNVVVGNTGSGNGASLTVNGALTQADVTGAVSAFTTGTGAVSLNGDVTVATGKNLHMVSTGSGTFQTGTGTVTLYGSTTISGTNTFTTGSGAIALNGNVAIANSKTLTVGSAGNGGATTLFGNVVVGNTATGNGASLTVNGALTQADVTGAVSAFTTGTGAVSLNGDVTVASGKNLHMDSAGAGTFQTAQGQATFYGSTVVSGSNTFSTGSGAVSLNGATAVAAGKSFTVADPSNHGAVQLFGDVTVGGSTGSGTSSSLTVYGNVVFNNDNDGTVKTFTTAQGAITLKGDVSIDANKNLIMASSGTGAFTTGTGDVTLNGNTEVEQSKWFKIGGGNALNCASNNANPASTYCMANR
eukprot:TRINITY_DN4529_c0_g1_i1.p1 TRINITY_DN4529_c0_g1~~TRINITY_DN4529_c0_g1_i1.p1  ORF type:complete len:722 (+),score=123.64 TRINITY_DN4529_c0_g1_i1:138-2303(+)